MNQSTFSCMVCGSSRARPWLTACPDHYLGHKGSVDYMECLDCSLVQQSPIPSDVEALYIDYPIHMRRGVVQQWARRIFQRQVYLPIPRNSAQQTLLDYGCGDGTYLREARSHFRSVLGYEPNEAHAAALSRDLGTPVYGDKNELLRHQAGRVDVITAHYVLEHVCDLKEVFRLFQSLLTPGGLLHMAVPNIRSWEARLFGKDWHGLDAPRHVSFPDAIVLRSLADAYGLKVLRVAPAVFPNTLAASLTTVLTGHYRPIPFMLWVPFSWCVAMIAPSGTLVIHMTKEA